MKRTPPGWAWPQDETLTLLYAFSGARNLAMMTLTLQTHPPELESEVDQLPLLEDSGFLSLHS